MLTMIQLPEDVVSVGYKRNKINSFIFEQVFYSKEHDFKGAEEEFVKAGIGYRYYKVGDYIRVEVK